jgi:hypothetical protein
MNKPDIENSLQNLNNNCKTVISQDEVNKYDDILVIQRTIIPLLVKLILNLKKQKLKYLYLNKHHLIKVIKKNFKMVLENISFFFTS